MEDPRDSGPHRQIEELLYAWVDGFDRADPETLHATLAPDAEVTMTRPGTEPAWLRGRAEIVGYFLATREAMTGQPRHLVTNVRSEVLGDTAAATAAVLVMLTTSSEPRLVACGTYEDEMVRRDGSWVFSRRTIALDNPPRRHPAPDPPDSVPS